MAVARSFVTRADRPCAPTTAASAPRTPPIFTRSPRCWASGLEHVGDQNLSPGEHSSKRAASSIEALRVVLGGALAEGFP